MSHDLRSDNYGTYVWREGMSVDLVKTKVIIEVYTLEYVWNYVFWDLLDYYKRLVWDLFIGHDKVIEEELKFDGLPSVWRFQPF